MPETVLVLGGERSGKSDFAQSLAARLGEPVCYLATAEARDAEMAARIAAHRAARPASWRTIECPHDVATAVGGQASGARTILLDCLTLLVSNCLEGLPPAETQDVWVDDALWPRAESEVRQLLAAVTRLDAHLIVVSNEVGMGLVPPNPAARAYRDALGRANQLVAAAADAVFLMVAGIPVDIKALAATAAAAGRF